MFDNSGLSSNYCRVAVVADLSVDAVRRDQLSCRHHVSQYLSAVMRKVKLFYASFACVFANACDRMVTRFHNQSVTAVKQIRIKLLGTSYVAREHDALAFCLDKK